MIEGTFSRKLDVTGRIMIPVKLRERVGLVPGNEYSFELFQINGHNYVCIDCGPASEVPKIEIKTATVEELAAGGQ